MPDILSLSQEEIDSLLEIVEDDSYYDLKKSIKVAKALIQKHKYIKVPIETFKTMYKLVVDYRTLLQEIEKDEK